MSRRIFGALVPTLLFCLTSPAWAADFLPVAKPALSTPAQPAGLPVPPPPLFLTTDRLCGACSSPDCYSLARPPKIIGSPCNGGQGTCTGVFIGPDQQMCSPTTYLCICLDVND